MKLDDETEELRRSLPVTEIQQTERRSKRSKKEKPISAEELSILLNNRQIIPVESLNLEDYEVIKINNYIQLIEIATQENSPIYHIADENSHDFNIILPASKLSYNLFAKKE
jgi:hypothetical protein